jgi:hypothetical protein
MSALGQKRTLQHVRSMSALPPKAEIGSRGPTAQRSALSSCWIDRSVRPTELAVGPLSAFAERNSLAAPY